MTKHTIILAHQEARQLAHKLVDQAPEGFCMVISERARSLEQNAAQWPILQAFAAQLQWPVNGQMVYMSDEEWKDVLTAAFRKEQARLAMGIDGGVVMLGQRTSSFGKGEFSDWLDFLHATAAAKGVTC